MAHRMTVSATAPPRDASVAERKLLDHLVGAIGLLRAVLQQCHGLLGPAPAGEPVEPGHENHSASVVFGQVVGVHIDDGILKDGRVDTLAFRPVARLGYSEYTTTENVWRMPRPDDSGYR